MNPRYSFEPEPHGAGGFAAVIKGRDKTLERDVAVKVLDPLATEFDDVHQERFRREARILAQMSHPNIPAVYDVQFGENSFLIIFEFVAGDNLRTILEQEGPSTLPEAKNWFTQIASALKYAHDKGIVHRDIKPENIVITPDRSNAYLVDFGIALSEEEGQRLTESGYVIGTPGYMSPEQQRGGDVDHRTDIYSLAVTLYEVLAGQSIPVGDYEELALINEAIPPELDQLVRDCLTDQEARISDAKEFATRLSGALRPTRPLSEVLGRGRLHEVANALQELSAEEFADLPEGQRGLILARVDDIVASGDPQLRFPAQEFLNLLLDLGLRLDQDDYREIASAAVEWGFEKSFNGHLGSKAVRRAYEQAAQDAGTKAHAVLMEEFSAFLDRVDLSEKEDWFLHAVREAISTLLANPNCTEGSEPLIAGLREANRLQRGRSNGGDGQEAVSI